MYTEHRTKGTRGGRDSEWPEGDKAERERKGEGVVGEGREGHAREGNERDVRVEVIKEAVWSEGKVGGEWVGVGGSG